MGQIHVIFCSQHYSRVDSFFDLFAFQVFDRGYHAQVAHFHWILDYQSLKVSVFEVDYRLRAGIKAHHFNFSSGQPKVAKCLGHGNGRWFARAEDAIYLAAKSVQDILRGLISQFARGSCMLVR